ncbi:MAG: primosomal protein N' [Actinomycetota bacterium]
MARVVVDTPLSHLDRLFDYEVPSALAGGAVPGSRVRVRFAGRLVDGFVLERVDGSAHPGKLTPIARSVSAESVVSPEIAALARGVADRYAGSLADVLRLAVPPRHARIEAAPQGEPAGSPEPPDLDYAGKAWSAYDGGAALLRELARGEAPRAVWQVTPGEDWPLRIAEAAQATLSAGRGVVIVAPDARDVARIDAALKATIGSDRFRVLSADLGPAERYRRWLAVRRGLVRCAVGTRSAGFAPVADVGLVVCWDDGDDLHKEPRAPYPHLRDVLVLRAHLAGSAAIIGGYAVTCEALQLVDRGWAKPVAADRAVRRAAAPRVHVAGSDTDLARDPAARAARLPSVAWDAARRALVAGDPVLVQTPRAGYQPALACDTCRSLARCAHCAGPLALSRGDGVPQCGWCGRPAADWTCASCRSTRLRSAATGSRRTAEELGRSFPGVPVRTSDGEQPLLEVPAGPALVVATPGAEPVAAGGYGAVLLLDAGTVLARAELRAGEEALRRWLAAAALAKSAKDGGIVVIMAESSVAAVQALVRWDPAGLARRELGERAALGFPPTVRMAAIDGTPSAVAELLGAVVLPPGAEVLGPVAHRAGARALIRVARSEGLELATALHAALAVRSARKATEPVRVELDPLELV